MNRYMTTLMNPQINKWMHEKTIINYEWLHLKMNEWKDEYTKDGTKQMIRITNQSTNQKINEQIISAKELTKGMD